MEEEGEEEEEREGEEEGGERGGERGGRMREGECGRENAGGRMREGGRGTHVCFLSYLEYDLLQRRRLDLWGCFLLKHVRKYGTAI